MSIWDLALYGDPNWQRFYGNVQASEQRKGEMYARNRAQRLEGEQAQAELEQRGQIANMEAAQRAYENEAQREFQSEQMQQRAAIEQEQAIEAQVREYDMWRKKMDVQLELKKEPIEKYKRGRDAIRAMVARGELAQKDAATALEDLARETDMTPQELEHQIEYQTWKKVNTPMQKQYDDNKVELPDGTVLVPPGMFDDIKPVKETPEQYQDRLAAEKEERDADKEYKREQNEIAKETNRINRQQQNADRINNRIIKLQSEYDKLVAGYAKPYGKDGTVRDDTEIENIMSTRHKRLMDAIDKANADLDKIYGEMENDEAVKSGALTGFSEMSDLDAQEAEIDRQIAEEKAKRGIQ